MALNRQEYLSLIMMIQNNFPKTELDFWVVFEKKKQPPSEKMSFIFNYM